MSKVKHSTARDEYLGAIDEKIAVFQISNE